MRGKAFVVAWREGDTPEALKAAYQKERESQVRTRLHGLWLLRSGWPLGTVAEALGSHYRSVQRWVAWYREGGVSLIRSHKMGGRGQQPFLSPEAQEQVAEVVVLQPKDGSGPPGRFETGSLGSMGPTTLWTGSTACCGGSNVLPRYPVPSTSRPTSKRRKPGKKGAPRGPDPGWSESGDARGLCR